MPRPSCCGFAGRGISFGPNPPVSGKEEIIKEYLRKRVPYAVIARLLDVHRLTVISFIKSRKLTIEEVGNSIVTKVLN